MNYPPDIETRIESYAHLTVEQRNELLRDVAAYFHANAHLRSREELQELMKPSLFDLTIGNALSYFLNLAIDAVDWLKMLLTKPRLAAGKDVRRKAESQLKGC